MIRRKPRPMYEESFKCAYCNAPCEVDRPSRIEACCWACWRRMYGGSKYGDTRLVATAYDAGYRNGQAASPVSQPDFAAVVALGVEDNQPGDAYDRACRERDYGGSDNPAAYAPLPPNKSEDNQPGTTNAQ